MKKLSIIIPAYNVERYIYKCLLSTQCQNVECSEYEVIVIIDGSKDRSLEIAQSISNKSDNIHVIYQDNEGLSGARNNGLNFATGEYVWFVDSDDWIENNCLHDIFGLLDGRVDIIQLQRRLVYDNPDLNCDLDIISIPKMSGKDVLKYFKIPAPAQFCVYRRQFLIDNGLKFRKGILHEDSEFKPRAVYFAKSMMSHNEIVYNYYQRTDGNIMSSFTIKNVRDIITVNRSLIDFSSNIESNMQRVFSDFIGLNTNTIVCGYFKLSSKEKDETVRLLKQNRTFFNRMLYSRLLYYQIEGFVFVCSIKLGIIIYRMIKVFL